MLTAVLLKSISLGGDETIDTGCVELYLVNVFFGGLIPFFADFEDGLMRLNISVLVSLSVGLYSVV